MILWPFNFRLPSLDCVFHANLYLFQNSLTVPGHFRFLHACKVGSDAAFVCASMFIYSFFLSAALKTHHCYFWLIWGLQNCVIVRYSIFSYLLILVRITRLFRRHSIHISVSYSRCVLDLACHGVHIYLSRLSCSVKWKLSWNALMEWGKNSP